nr:hypothetical protein [Actinomycetota bacterium]
MATQTRRRPPAKGRPAPARRRASGRTPPRRPPARKPRRPAPKRPSRIAQTLRWTGVHIRTAPVEVWGLVVLFGGVLSGLGIYSGGAGPVGGALDYLGRLFVGGVALGIPIVVVGAGLSMIVPRARPHVLRLLAAVGLVGISLAGIIHLWSGNKPLHAPLEKLQNIGGIFGALIARPLSGLIGLWATWFL